MSGQVYSPKKILFHREFTAPAGGHLKVWHYFNHVNATPGFQAQIYFTPNSLWDATNPWREQRHSVLTSWQPEEADILFLAGMDWRALPENQQLEQKIPVINLVQGIRHSHTEEALYQFLKRRSIRICVSPEVRDAIVATGNVNGPVFCIPNGTDLAIATDTTSRRDIPLLICGQKNPRLGTQLATELNASGTASTLLTDFLPRPEFIDHLQRAEITVFLPLPEEGFYLPALEGLAAGTLVICPDCVGNRSFCIDDANSLRPHYTLADISAATTKALALNDAAKARMRAKAQRTAVSHSLHNEQRMFREILDNLNHIW